MENKTLIILLLLVAIAIITGRKIFLMRRDKRSKRYIEVLISIISKKFYRAKRDLIENYEGPQRTNEEIAVSIRDYIKERTSSVFDALMPRIKSLPKISLRFSSQDADTNIFTRLLFEKMQQNVAGMLLRKKDRNFALSRSHVLIYQEIYNIVLEILNKKDEKKVNSTNPKP